MTTDNTLAILDAPVTAVLQLKWYGAHQNNSGGSYVIDDAVAEWVFVQAATVEAAERKLSDITESSGYDWCECCGERWSIWLSEADGHSEPMIYGTPLRTYPGSGDHGWMDGQQVRLYAHDGRIASYTLPRSP